MIYSSFLFLPLSFSLFLFLSSLLRCGIPELCNRYHYPGYPITTQSDHMGGMVRYCHPLEISYRYITSEIVCPFHHMLLFVPTFCLFLFSWLPHYMGFFLYGKSEFFLKEAHLLFMASASMTFTSTSLTAILIKQSVWIMMGSSVTAVNFGSETSIYILLLGLKLGECGIVSYSCWSLALP